jgi:hypothetical protein
MKRLFFLFISFELLPLITFASFIQADTTSKKSKYYFWLSAGGQYSFSDNFHSLIGGGGGLTCLIKQKHFLSLKSYGCISTDITNPSFSFSDTNRSNQLFNILNISLLYGRTPFKTKCFTIITSAGISYGKAMYVGKYLYMNSDGFWDNAEYETDTYNYIGLPLNVSFMLTSPFIGLSIDLYANIHKHPDYGFTLNTHFGKIRGKKITA